MTRSLVLTAVLAGGLGVPVTGMGQSMVPSGSVMLELPQVMSMDGLKQVLQARGYSQILLSSILPTTYNPRPDIQENGPRSITFFNPADVPVHRGWNGTAVKDGKRLNINVRINASGNAVGRVIEE